LTSGGFEEAWADIFNIDDGAAQGMQDDDNASMGSIGSEDAVECLDDPQHAPQPSSSTASGSTEPHPSPPPPPTASDTDTVLDSITIDKASGEIRQALDKPRMIRMIS